MGMIEGILLYCDAFTSVLNVSQKQLHDKFKEGAIKFQGKPLNWVESTEVSEAKAWMTCLFCQIGDRMYASHVYVAEQGMDEKECVSLSWFYKVWDKSFHHSNTLFQKYKNSHRYCVGMHNGCGQ